MAEKKVTRKLAAILATDMVGFSRLMEKDEAGTVARQKAHRSVLMDPKIAEHNGRIVKSTGDGLLVEFASAVDAVQCAVAIQRAMPKLEADVLEERRIAYRIGVNLGDIIVEDNDILGDGVNIAARLQMLAEPGGICISRPVFTQIRNKVELGFVDLGPQKVKNIEEPVLTYKVLLDPAEAGIVLAAKRARPKRLRWTASAAAAVLLLVFAGLAWWQPWIARVEPARPAKMAFPLPAKPSIAVLPFGNLSGDTKQDYLADGLTENITTALSKLSEMLVIDRKSSAAYKDKAGKVQEVAEALGVRYVLEGGVQQSGKRIRVTVHLIDSVRGRHLWSERYDRKLADFLDVQDEITKRIVVELQVKLTRGEMTRLSAGRSKNLETMQLTQRAVHLFERFAKQDNAQARQLAKRCIELDPKDSTCWVVLAWTHWSDARYRWSKSPARSMDAAAKAAQKARATTRGASGAGFVFGGIHMIRREHDKAIAAQRKALEGTPNYASGYAQLAGGLTFAGRPQEAIDVAKKGMRLSPAYPEWYLAVLGRAYRMTRRFEEAIAANKAAVRHNPNSILYQIELTATLSDAGRAAEARAAAAEVLRINPKFTVSGWAKTLIYKNPADQHRFLEALRKAGLPDHSPMRKGKLAFPLPKKPSIAVLPFNNLSGDKAQEYLADGLSENIISSLSKVSEMFVIARNSTFTYKGKPVKVQRVAEELGVRFVLEGSVQRAGDRIRVTAQLIDATTGHHLWSERYDRKLTDLFAVQDEITLKIVTALQVNLTEGEQAQARARSTNNLRAWGLFVEALARIERYTRQDNSRARALARQAVALDPNYASAWRTLAWTHWLDARFGWSPSPAKSFQMAVTMAQKAVTLAPKDSETQVLMASIHLFRRDFGKAVTAGRAALQLGPNMGENKALVAITMNAVGDWDQSIQLIRSAIRLHPRFPSWYLLYLSRAYAFKEDPRSAIAAAKKGLARAESDDLRAGFHLVLAWVYSETGRMESARKHVAAALKLDPGLSVQGFRSSQIYKNPVHLERIVTAMKKAGLPEK